MCGEVLLPVESDRREERRNEKVSRRYVNVHWRCDR